MAFVNSCPGSFWIGRFFIFLLWFEAAGLEPNFFFFPDCFLSVPYAARFVLSYTCADMASQSIQCANVDNSFGPHASNCRGNFDFTLLFEESILSLLPTSIIILAALPRIWHLIKRATKVESSILLYLKLVGVCCHNEFSVGLNGHCLLTARFLLGLLRRPIRLAARTTHPLAEAFVSPS
jgi:hypothetical protein